jgi:S1-C subfamily serine protease
MPLNVFYSYSHKDEKLLEKLKAHLAGLERSEAVASWSDCQITAGSDWRREILQALEAADVILLLVSADFMKSDFCQSVELKRAIERHEQDRALIIPILLRPCVITGTALEKFQCIPKGGKPVTEWPNRDRAFVDIVERIRTALSAFEPRPAQAPAAKHPVREVLHRVFGPNEFQSPSFLKIALQSAQAVARLEYADHRGAQTGGLVRLSDFGLAKTGLGVLTVKYSGSTDGPSNAFFELDDCRVPLGSSLWRSTPVDELGGVEILAVDGIPSSIEPLTLGSTLDVKEGEPALIISYPLGGPLAFSLRDGRVVQVTPNTVVYRSATQPGSSGAPVFDDDWNVIGIHTRRNPDGSKAGFAIDALRDKASRRSVHGRD